MRFISSLPYFKVACAVLVFAAFVSARIVFAMSAADISADLAPANPAPHENTDITLSSYLANLDSVLITWNVNGKVAASGIGKKTFSVMAGDTGSETRVDILINMPDGAISKRVTIRPSVMTMLWQATDSYVPPFYKGKALLTQGSQVKVVAMPEIKSGASLVSPKNMTYSWQRDYTNQPADSGYSKNYFTYVGDYLDDDSTVSVTASTLDQKYSSAGSIQTSTTANPVMAFYRKDPTFGVMWEQALFDGYRVNGTDTIFASPYFLSPSQFVIPSLVFRWYIDDQMQPIQLFAKNILPLKVDTGASGSAALKLTIENTDSIFPPIQGDIQVQF